LSATAAFAQAPRPAEAVLTVEHARDRALRVSRVAYDLAVRLDGRSPEYSGAVTVTFELADATRDLTLDFTGGSIASMRINGKETAAAYNGFYLTLPRSALRAGENRVAIEFAHPYSSDGSGLYRFVDPEDGRHYLYTDFEPYNHNRLFPSFDQPNLKASYATRATVPKDWHVVSIVAESNVQRGAAEAVWTFPRSAPISTYTFALHAGQYRVWEARAGKVPLRLFARESVARYVKVDEWFLITRQGFEFFERYFDVAYPFGKYDQVIVPHFNAGAMENVGAVTFSERYLRRGAVTREDRRTLASVVLHEMAHMWFGDLVTMDWWNGLWLNESFATFMATLAMSEATEFTDELESAYRSTVRAYRADERETTHPIELPVPDTDSAFSNFDAITYEKGSATLKQLNHLVGPEAFRRGVSAYLKQHAYGNTSIDDFLGSISAAADRDLQPWAQEWLGRAGANAIDVELHCNDGAIGGLAVLQSAPAAWPTLRTHRTQLGLYRFEGGGVVMKTLPVTYSGARTAVEDLNGEPCPDLLFANHGDWDYVRAQLDLRMLPALNERLALFPDPLIRAMLWQSVWEMVLDTRLRGTDFVDFALANLAAEHDEGIVAQVLGTVQLALRYLTFAEADAAAGMTAKVASFLWEQIAAREPGGDQQVAMFDCYVAIAQGAEVLAALAALLEEQRMPPDGIRLDQDRRWNVLQILSEAEHPGLDALIAKERLRDPSDQGRLRALAVEAARPDLDVKRGWLQRLLGDSDLTLADARAASAGLFPSSQHRLRAALSDEILGGLAVLNQNRNSSYFASFVSGLLGPLCDAQYLEKLDAAIGAAEALHPILRRGLRNSRFEVARCIAIGARESEKKEPDR
jgi:aminopeptidase N